MTPNEMKAEVACQTAEELLLEMRPSTGRLWKGGREHGISDGEWIFRGVPDAHYTLTPSAFRTNAFTSFIPGQVTRPVLDGREQRDLEDHFLTQFCTETDRMEISVPSDRPELRDLRCALREYDPHEFPPINKLHMFALAQHYGVPTRLLDWSRHPLVATYFAVHDVALVRTKRPGVWSITGQEPCAVWALNLSFVRFMMKETITNASIDPAIHVVTAPYATNPNLAAQGGLFTLVQPRSGDPHPLPNLDVALAHMADQVPTSCRWKEPVLFKFVLPAREARVALRLLDLEGITAAAIRPGIAGVVDAMRDRWAHQCAHPGQRS